MLYKYRHTIKLSIRKQGKKHTKRETVQFKAHEVTLLNFQAKQVTVSICYHSNSWPAGVIKCMTLMPQVCDLDLVKHALESLRIWGYKLKSVKHSKRQTNNNQCKLWEEVVQSEDRMMPRDFYISRNFHKQDILVHNNQAFNKERSSQWPSRSVKTRWFAFNHEDIHASPQHSSSITHNNRAKHYSDLFASLQQQAIYSTRCMFQNICKPVKWSYLSVPPISTPTSEFQYLQVWQLCPWRASLAGT